MDVQIRDSQALKLKLTRSDGDRKPVSFLVGAPFSLERGVGVPDVAGFIEIIRERVARSGDALLQELDRQLEPATDAQRYQIAMAFVYDFIDADAAQDIVRAAVLRARKPGAPPLEPTAAYDGAADEWNITHGQQHLALIMKLAPERFPGPIFTTNFDPMISLALLDQGFGVNTIGIPLEGNINAPVKHKKTDVDVFHLHGYWRDSPTLHRPQQLLAARPQLQNSIQRHLDATHLIVLAYGGWEDVFTTAIANVLNDQNFRGTVSWCFYNDNPHIVRAENQLLFEKFATGIAQSRISFFCGVDCHRFFDELIGFLGFTPAARASVEASPMPGWLIVTPESLDAQPALTDAEAVRFFDGAVPSLRHADSRLIPRLSNARRLVERLRQGAADGLGMQVIRAAAGEGKSTALLQAAVDLARAREWTVLYRPDSDAGLRPDIVAQLDKARKWLIVADDAEGLIDDVWSAVRKLGPAGSRNIFFLLAARDTDWRLMAGDAIEWSTRLTKLDDLTFGRLDTADAGLVVDAWTIHGDEGLRALTSVGTREKRIGQLVQATRAQHVRRDEGSFYGGLLATRFAARGLVEHLLPLLRSLRQQPIDGGTATLYDALLYVASCHSMRMLGLDNRVLAALCGVSVYRVTATIVVPLGKELGAGESRGHVMTRHKRVADAVIVAADRLGTDLADVWRRLVTCTAQLERANEVSRECHGAIMHSGARLKRSLPQVLDPELRGDIGIAAAEAAVAARPKRMSNVIDLARALRVAGYSSEACDLLLEKLPLLKNMVDKDPNFRGFFFEWGTCEGNVGGRLRQVHSVWLDCFSLSDAVSTEVTAKNAKLICAGLGVAFEHLIDRQPLSPYAKGRRAAIEAGRRTNPDPKTAGYFDGHERALDKLGTPRPADLDEALGWLREAALVAWNELDDDNLRRLHKDGALTFTRLKRTLVRR